MTDSPEQQLVDMAKDEKDLFLKELLLRTAAMKITSDILKGDGGN
jgi:hypothetical protein